MDEAGEPQRDFIVDSLLETIPVKRHQLKIMIDNCTNFQSDDACENAYHVNLNQFYHFSILPLHAFCSFSHVFLTKLLKNPAKFPETRMMNFELIHVIDLLSVETLNKI